MQRESKQGEIGTYIMWICTLNTTKPLQRASTNNAIQPDTYIIRICTKTDKASTEEKGESKIDEGQVVQKLIMCQDGTQ